MNIKERANRKINLMNEVWDTHLWAEQYDTKHVFKLIAEIVDGNPDEPFPSVRSKFKEQLYQVPVNGRVLRLR